MTEVYLHIMLAQFTPRRRVSSSATSISGLLDGLETRFSKFKNRLRNEMREIRPFVKVFVNGEEIPRERGSSTPPGPSDEVELLHSIQGG